MPRTAPDTTTEHRVTLGTFERERLEAMVKAANRDRTLEAVAQLAGPVAAVGAAYVVYQGMVGWGEGRNRIAEWWQNITSPSTGPTTADVANAAPGVVDTALTLVFGPLGYTGGGTFSDGSRIGDFWRKPDGGGGGGF
ncbi:MAG: hypothetical protein ACPGQO_05795 [Candidatus Poseidoniaceae archaeon]